MSVDQDALICDFAETYGIYDLRGLPVFTLATLAAGLRENSRIKMRLSGISISRMEALVAAAVDRLSMLCWTQTEDGQRNENPPKSMISILLNQEEGQERKVQTYKNGRDFDRAWKDATGVEH